MSTPSESVFKIDNYNAWLRTLAEQFGGNVPDASYWYNPDDIWQILQRFGAVDSLVCALVPGGWLDLRGAGPSVESGSIKLHLGGLTYVYKPNSLWFLGLRDVNGEQWSYFHLHTRELTPVQSNVLSPVEYSQRLTQLSHSEHPGSESLETRSTPEQPESPATEREATRRLRSNIVFVLKSSPYFQNIATDLGEHSSMTPAQFRGLMEHKRDKYSSKV